MARKNTAAKIFAFLALFGIVLGIIWTWALFIFWNSQTQEDNNIDTISPEELQNMIDSWNIKIENQVEITK